MKRTVATSVALVVALGIVACSTSSTPSDEVIVTPGPPVAPRVDPSTPPVTNAPNGGCEDLGTLAATSLVGTLDTSEATPVESTTITLAGRPVLSKIRVIASGDPNALVGHSAVLGAGTNVSFATCSHCLLVAVGCAPGCASAALFYPRSGTATFTALASQPGQTFQGTFDDVELEQVDIDPVSLVSTPVPGGACFRIRSMTFTASIQSAGSVGTNTDDAGGGGSSSGGSDAGGDGGSKSGGGGGGGGSTPKTSNF